METEMNLWQAIKAVMEGEKVVECEDDGGYYMEMYDGVIYWSMMHDGSIDNIVTLSSIVTKKFKIYEPPVDWTKVPVDTPVWVWDNFESEKIWAYFSMYLPKAEYPFWVFSNEQKQENANIITRYRHCKLRKEADGE